MLIGRLCLQLPIQTSFAITHMPEAADWHRADPIKLDVPDIKQDMKDQ